MKRTRILNAALMTLTLLGASACASDVPDVAASTDRISFSEFAAETYREPWEGGVWIVDGDTPIPTERHLYEHYLRVYGGSSLIVHQAGGADSAWNSHRKRNLTCCVSTNFGTRYEEMVDLMREAALAWEEVSDVTFIHLSEEDATGPALQGERGRSHRSKRLVAGPGATQLPTYAEPVGRRCAGHGHRCDGVRLGADLVRLHRRAA